MGLFKPETPPPSARRSMAPFPIQGRAIQEGYSALYLPGYAGEGDRTNREAVRCGGGGSGFLLSVAA